MALTILVPLTADAQSIRFFENEPKQYDFADQRALPPTFGVGEFTFEVWIKPDNGFPAGGVHPATFEQLRNWSTLDPRPYSSGGWWIPGNWLLDGHTRPEGFDSNSTREGTFSLQFYGGGRLRWMFGDDGLVVPLGKVWAVQAWPADKTPSLLDGRWHHVACVRRWVEEGGAQLELWIDGKLIATQRIPQRVNMRKYWDALPHPKNPTDVGGWAWGAEVMTAWNYFFTQFEDYKGLVDEIRFWDRAKTTEELSTTWNHAVSAGAPGLVGHFDFSEGKGDTAHDRLDPARVLKLHRQRPETWSAEDPPLLTQ